MPDTDTIALPPALAAVAAGKPSEPNPAARQQAAIVQLLLQANVAQQLGGWAGDRWEQTSKYAGIPALAIRPYLNAVRAAKFTVLERAQNPRDGVVSKALPSGHYGRDEGYQPLDPDHPLCRIVERPGGKRGTWTLPREAAYCTLQNFLTGDAPCWAPVNDQGKPVQFYALVSAATQLQFGAGVNPQYPQGAYRVTPAAGGYGFGLSGGVYAGAILPAEEVHRLTDEDPLYRGAGRARTALGAKELDVLESITTSRWSFFQEGTQLDTVITIPGADSQTCKSLQEAITRAHGGANKHGRRILVVGGGGIDSKLGIQPTGMNHEEMGFLQSYEQAMGVVLALFGVPKVVAAVESGGSYAADYAAKALWYEMGLVPFFLRMSDFLTQVLADPWSEYPGQYKIEVEPPPLKNEELEEKEREFAVAQGLITPNEYRQATGRKPLPDGDDPLPVMLAKQQQAIAPPPVPGMPPGAAAPGMPQGDAGGVPQGEDGQDVGGEDDSPEATQDATVQAALAALGLDGGDEQGEGQPDEIQKAVKPAVTKPGGNRVVRQEGQVWQANGKWWTKKNGHIQETAAPGQRPPQKPQAGGQDGLAAEPAWDRADPRQTSPQETGAALDTMAKNLLRGRPALKLVLPNQAGGKTAVHEVKDGASLKAFFEKGGKLPPEMFAEHAKQVPASTPAQQETLSKAREWAGQMAAKHANRLAQKLGISPAAAQRILVQAIVQVAEHAAKNGGRASGTLKVGGQSLKIGVRHKPTAGAPPRPENPAGKGSLPPRAVAKAVNRFGSRRAAACVEAALKALEGNHD